jgi:hypothetical protein
MHTAYGWESQTEETTVKWVDNINLELVHPVALVFKRK